MALNFQQVISSGIARGKSRDEIREALAKTNNLSSSAITELDAILPSEEVKDKTDYSKLSEAQTKAYGFGNRMARSEKIIDELDDAVGEKGFLSSIGYAMAQQAVGGSVTSQFVGEDFKRLDQAKRDWVNANLRKESGAVISPEEFRNAELQYFPQPGDSAEVIEQKRKNRVDVANDMLKTSGIEKEIPVRDAGNIKENFNKLYKFAQENPDDELSKKFMDDWNNDRFNLLTGKLKKEFQEKTPYEKKLEEVEARTKQEIEKITVTDVVPEEEGLLDKLGQRAQKIKDIISQSIGEDAEQTPIEGGFQAAGQTLAGIGDVIFEAVTSEAVQKAADVLTFGSFGRTVDGIKEQGAEFLKTDEGKAVLNAVTTGNEQWQKFKEENPRAARNIEASIEVASAVPIGRITKIGSDIAREAAGGAIEGAVRTGVGATSAVKSAVGSNVVQSAKSAISSKNNAQEALGQILQGKTKDLSSGQRALSILDVEDVNTFEDLGNKLDESIGTLSKQVDQVLEQDKTISKLSDLSVSQTTKGGKVVKTNPAEKALDNLEEMYEKIGDGVKAEEIRELRQRAINQGLTRKEVNDLSREYGQVFGSKAFSKTGDPLTSVNAQAFENTRKGLKDVAREGIQGAEAKELDALLSDSFATRDLVRKNADKVQTLKQKAEKMGLGRKAVRNVIKLLDTLSLGGTRAIRESFIQSNIGNKTMNFLDIEDNLNKNLKILQEAENAKTPKEMETILQKIQKIQPGLSIKDVSGEAIEKVAKKLDAEDIKRIENFTDRTFTAVTPEEGLKNQIELADEIRPLADSMGFQNLEGEDLAEAFSRVLEARRNMVNAPLK